MNLGLLRNVDRVSAQLDARRLIVRLSEACDLLPSSLAIDGVEDTSLHPLFGGTFGDIYKAQFQGNHVALKRLRLFQMDSAENLQNRRVCLFHKRRLELTTVQKFCREALIWKNLDHDYVLPFLGVDSESFPGFLCMVSPWMNKGPIVKGSGGPSTGSIPVLVRIKLPQDDLIDITPRCMKSPLGCSIFIPRISFTAISVGYLFESTKCIEVF